MSDKKSEVSLMQKGNSVTVFFEFESEETAAQFHELVDYQIQNGHISLTFAQVALRSEHTVS